MAWIRVIDEPEGDGELREAYGRVASARGRVAHEEDVEDDVRPLREQGLSDAAIHDAASVVAYFNFVNRAALGLGVELER